MREVGRGTDGLGVDGAGEDRDEGLCAGDDGAGVPGVETRRDVPEGVAALEADQGLVARELLPDPRLEGLRLLLLALCVVNQFGTHVFVLHPVK